MTELEQFKKDITSLIDRFETEMKNALATVELTEEFQMWVVRLAWVYSVAIIGLALGGAWLWIR